MQWISHLKRNLKENYLPMVEKFFQLKKTQGSRLLPTEEKEHLLSEEDILSLQVCITGEEEFVTKVTEEASVTTQESDFPKF